MTFDTFIPDLIVGIVTGLFVGVVLLVAQRRAEASKDRSNSKFAWESFKPKVSAAAHRTWEMDMDSMLPIPVALSALDELVASEPLALWASHLKKPDEAMELAMMFPSLRSSFDSRAKDIEASLGMLAARYTVTDSEETVVGRLIRARTYKLPDSEALGTVTGLSKCNLKRVTAMADKTEADPRMSASIERYQDAASLYADQITRLRRLLNPPEDGEELPALLPTFPESPNENAGR